VIAAGPALPELDRDLLTGPVRRLAGSPDAELLEWRCDPVAWTAVAQTTAGIFRVTGTLRDGSRTAPWSVILKIVARPERGPDGPSDRMYWRREVEAYESGLLAKTQGISLPRFGGAVTRENGNVWLWLEDIVEDRTTWTLGDYARLARALGVFNGGFKRLPIAEQPWMTRHFLPGWVEMIEPRTRAAVMSQATWEISAVKAGFPVPMTDRIVEICDRMPKLVAAFETLPVTLSHNDSWRTNVLLAADGRIVLIDWAWVGLSPLGVDLGMLTCATHFFFGAAPEELAAFDRTVFPAYLEGLRDSGWKGDPREIRFVYTTTAGLWSAITGPVWLPLWGDPARREWLEKKFGCSLEEASPRYAQALAFMLGLADEAWSLHAVVL
jgi:Phosphotransferase enzyme family